MSKIALELIEECKNTRSTTLDLSNCGLYELPKALFGCTWLEELNLSSRNEYPNRKIKPTDHRLLGFNTSNRLLAIPVQIQQLSALKVLNLKEGGNDAWEQSSLAHLGELKQLEVLNLFGCQVTDLSFLESLVTLKELHLGHRNLTHLGSLPEHKQLQKLHLGYGNMQDLTGIDRLSELSYLDLDSNEIEWGLDLLSNLPQLEYLNLTDQTPDSGLFPAILPALKHLILDYVNIDGLSDLLNSAPQLETLSIRFSNLSADAFDGVQRLPHLRTLDLHENHIQSLDFLEKFPALESLNLSENPINHLEFPIELLDLTNLEIKSCYLQDLSFPAELPALKRLDVSDNRLTKLDFVLELPQLEQLNLYHNQITSFSLFLEMPKMGLHWLNIRDNPASDVFFVDHFTQLHTLELSTNEAMKDMGFLQKLRQLHTLRWYPKPSTDTAILKDLPQLKELVLHAYENFDPKFISHLVSLEQLDLGYNDLTELPDLSGLIYLKKLRLEHNQIQNIGPLKYLEPLEELHLMVNQVVDLSPLTGLTRLRWLELDHNPLGDLSPLADLIRAQIPLLAELGNVVRIEINGNRVDLTPLRPLMQRGLDIRWGRYPDNDFTQAQQLIEACKATQNPRLDLGRCGLKALPPDVFDCTWLKELNLGDARSANQGATNHFGNFPQELECLENLQKLYLDSCLPPSTLFSVPMLYSLEELDVSGSRINFEAIEALMNACPELKKLNASHNWIKEWDWSALPATLEVLDLRGNEISDWNKVTDLWRDADDPGLQTVWLTGEMVSNAHALRQLKEVPHLNVHGLDWDLEAFVKIYTGESQRATEVVQTTEIQDLNIDTNKTVGATSKGDTLFITLLYWALVAVVTWLVQDWKAVALGGLGYVGLQAIFYYVRSPLFIGNLWKKH